MGYMVIKKDYSVGTKAKRCLIQAESASDISGFDDDTVAPGSVAYLEDMSKVYIMDSDGAFNEASADAIILAATFG